MNIILIKFFFFLNRTTQQLKLDFKIINLKRNSKIFIKILIDNLHVKDDK